MTALLERLYSVAARNRLPHGLLLVGPSSSELFFNASQLAKFLFCTSKESKRPCGICMGCQKVFEKIHPDLMVVETEKQELSIELIREFLFWIQRGPHESNLKVGIILDADTMNSAAQNALLKTLEEPPPHGKLILLSSHPDRLFPTILSRVQLIRLSNSEDQPSDLEEVPEWVGELKNLLKTKSAGVTDIFPVTEQIAKERGDLKFFFREFESFLKNKMLGPDTSITEFQKAAFVFEETLKAENDILRHYGNSQLTLDSLMTRWFA